MRRCFHVHGSVRVGLFCKLESQKFLELVHRDVAVTHHCELTSVPVAYHKRVVHCDVVNNVGWTERLMRLQVLCTVLFGILYQHLNVKQTFHDTFFFVRKRI